MADRVRSMMVVMMVVVSTGARHRHVSAASVHLGGGCDVRNCRSVHVVGIESRVDSCEASEPIRRLNFIACKDFWKNIKINS